MEVIWIAGSRFESACKRVGGETVASDRSIPSAAGQALRVTYAYRCVYAEKIIDPFTSTKDHHYALEAGVYFQDQADADHLRDLRMLEAKGMRTDLDVFQEFAKACGISGGAPGVWFHGISARKETEWDWTCRCLESAASIRPGASCGDVTGSAPLSIQSIQGSVGIPEITVTPRDEEEPVLDWLPSPWNTRNEINEEAAIEQLSSLWKKVEEWTAKGSETLESVMTDSMKREYEEYRAYMLRMIPLYAKQSSENFSNSETAKVISELEAKMNPFHYIPASKVGSQTNAHFEDLGMACMLGGLSATEDVVYAPLQNLTVFGLFLLKKADAFRKSPIGEAVRSYLFVRTMVQNFRHIFYTIWEQIKEMYEDAIELEDTEAAHLVCYLAAQVYGSKLYYEVVIGDVVAPVANGIFKIIEDPTRTYVTKRLTDLRKESLLAKFLMNHRVESFLKAYSKAQLWTRMRRLELEIRSLVTRFTGHTSKIEVRAKELVEREKYLLLKAKPLDPEMRRKWNALEKEIEAKGVLTAEMQAKICGEGSSEFRFLELDRENPGSKGQVLFDGEDRMSLLQEIAVKHPNLRVETLVHRVDEDETLSRITRLRFSLRYTLAEYHFRESGIPFERWGLTPSPWKEEPPSFNEKSNEILMP